MKQLELNVDYSITGYVHPKDRTRKAVAVVKLRSSYAFAHPLLVLNQWVDSAEEHMLDIWAHHTFPPEVAEIINKYLRGDQDILLCQDELIEAGFAEWARI